MHAWNDDLLPSPPEDEALICASVLVEVTPAASDQRVATVERDHATDFGRIIVNLR